MVFPGGHAAQQGVAGPCAGRQGPAHDLEPLSKVLARLLRYPTPGDNLDRHAQGWCRLRDVVALPMLRRWSEPEVTSVIMESQNRQGPRFEMTEYDRVLWVRARQVKDDGPSSSSNEISVADASFQHWIPPPRQRPTPPRARQAQPEEPKSPPFPTPQEDNRNALSGVDGTRPSSASRAGTPSELGSPPDPWARSPPEGMAESSATCLAPSEEQEVENLASADALAAQVASGYAAPASSAPGRPSGSAAAPSGHPVVSGGGVACGITAPAPATPPPPEFILHRSVSSLYRDWVLMTQWPTASTGVWMAAEDFNAFFYINEPGVWACYRDSGNGHKVYWFNHDTEEWFFAEESSPAEK